MLDTWAIRCPRFRDGLLRMLFLLSLVGPTVQPLSAHVLLAQGLAHSVLCEQKSFTPTTSRVALHVDAVFTLGLPQGC
jgi:hypothetical protein